MVAYIHPSSENGGVNVSICGRDSDVAIGRTLFGEAAQAPDNTTGAIAIGLATCSGSHLVRSGPEPHCNLQTEQRGSI